MKTQMTVNKKSKLPQNYAVSFQYLKADTEPPHIRFIKPKIIVVLAKNCLATLKYIYKTEIKSFAERLKQ